MTAVGIELILRAFPLLLNIIFESLLQHEEEPGDHVIPNCGFMESFNPCLGLLLAIRNPNASHLVHFGDGSADSKALAQSVLRQLDFYQDLMFSAGRVFLCGMERR